MPIVEVQHNGQTYEIDVPEGQDVGTAVADFERSVGVPTQTPTGAVDDLPSLDDGSFVENRPEKGFLENLGDRIGVVGDFAKGTFRDITGANVDDDGTRTVPESAQRGAGLAARSITGAIPTTAAGLTDLGEVALNAVAGGIDTGDRFIAENVFGREPREPRPPLFQTDHVGNVDALLNELFPQPETFGERVVDVGGEALFTGGMGSAALAGRVDDLATVPSLADDIGLAFRNRPVMTSVAEFGGGAGAQTGGELAQDAELGPGGQLLATLGGGLAGALTPQTIARTATGTANTVRQAVEPITPAGAERRAARTLQGEARDPAAAAQASRDAPEGVTGSRASEDPNLRRIERKAAEDNPAFADEIDEMRAGAETRTIDEFSEGLTPGQDPVEWQRQVVARSAPEGTTIAGGQPDEMLEEAFQSFRAGYAEADGFPVQTQVVQVEGGNVGLPEAIEGAIVNPRVLAGEGARDTIGNWVRATYDDIARRGTPITNQADETIVQFDSSDMLDFRQTIRAQQRRLEAAGRTNPDAAAQAQILRDVDAAITESLESQLPEAASNALRALDTRYTDFKTVEDAVLRGTPGELTPANLSQSIKQTAGTRGRVARGETGDLGDLAEQGRDVTKFLGKNGAQDQALERTIRGMTPEQQTGVRSDLVRDLIRRSQRGSRDTGDLRLDGDKILKELEANDSTLRAAGFEDGDITRLTQLARRLRMIQSPDPRPAGTLIDDHLGALQGLISRVAGAKTAKRITAATGTGGPGVLSLTGFMSRLFEKTFGRFSVGSAERLIEDAMQPTPQGRELFESLMTRATAGEPQRLRAERTLNAWAAQAASIDNGEE